MRKLIFTKIPLLLAALLLAAPAPALAEGLRETIDAILASPKLEGARLAVRVIELPHGRVLYSFNSEETLKVASNAKLVTTAAALDLLGADFELSTTLVARGDVRDNTLYGDLVIVGKGDPSMSEHWYGSDVLAPLRRFAHEVAATGIKTVSGDLVANDLYFDRIFHCPSWPSNQYIHWYEAPVAALAFNDNCVDAVIAPGSTAGSTALIKLYPEVGYIDFTNLVKTSATKKSPVYGFYRQRLENAVTAKGYYPLKAGPAETNFTVHDPSLYLATALKKTLNDAGIEVRGRVRRLYPEELPELEGAQVIAVNRIPLSEAVRFCNVNSQNLYAEMILKTLGREVEGEGSFDAGVAAVSRFLQKVSVRPGEYTMADGSGLSAETRFSAMALTEVLKAMFSHKDVKTFRDSLPLSGYPGSLSSRLDDEPYRGRVRAKTGYILKASALSGYAKTANDKTLAFSMIFNDFNGSNRYNIKPVQDEICRTLVDSKP